ncbi:MAG: 30S ribosomal protein S17 [Candidatus Woesearchaeota archaeon]
MKNVKKTMGNEEQASANCGDRHCPIHSGLKTRGRQFVGTIVKASAQKTATVQWNWSSYIPKYERYEKKRTKLHVHVPDCIKIKVGDLVKVMECKPISKTKSFVVIEVLEQ